jgi:adenylate cyclase
VDAVRCAVRIQEELKERNKEFPENRRMEFRVGINLGDVVEEGPNILGDGVNIAARVESLAEAGGICISGIVYESIKNKLAFGYEYLGDQVVKNIKEPVRVYRILMEPGVKGAPKRVEKRLEIKVSRRAVLVLGVAVAAVVGTLAIWQFFFRPSPPKLEVASKEKMAFPLPDRPSIAVLPFVNMSADPEQEFFSDGITEEIITALSKVPRLFVIARNSTFTYKGRPVKVKQVSEDLGVRYVLEGSVRKEGDKVRITAQLIDAVSGNHLWAERYDRDLKDIFALQDEITLKIIQALQVTLTPAQQARVIGKGTENLNAYLKTLQASEHFLRMNKQGSTMAKQLAKEAIALDPEYARPYAVLALSHMLDLWFRFSESPEESMKLAVDAAEKALALDDSDYLTHTCFSALYIMQRQHDKAIASAERALELSPGGVRPLSTLGVALIYACRFSEAVQYFEQAIRLDPFPPSTLFRNLGIAYRGIGRYEDAIVQYKKALKLEPDDLFTHLGLAHTYIKLAREKEAQAEAAEVLRIHPKFSLEHYAKTLPLKDQSFADDYIMGLRQAGLK